MKNIYLALFPRKYLPKTGERDKNEQDEDKNENEKKRERRPKGVSKMHMSLSFVRGFIHRLYR